MKIRIRHRAVDHARVVGRGLGRPARQRDHVSGHHLQEPDRVPGRDLRRAPRRPGRGRGLREGASGGALRRDSTGSSPNGTSVNARVPERAATRAARRGRAFADLDGGRDRRARDRRRHRRLADRGPHAPADPADHATGAFRVGARPHRAGRSPRTRTTSSRISPTPSTTCSIGWSSRSSRSGGSRRRCRTSCGLRSRWCAAKPTSCGAEAESDATRATADNIKTATVRAERIISVAARARPGRERADRSTPPLALDEVVGDTVAEVLENRQWQDIRVDVELHPVVVRGDRALIDCIVRNLVDNAARHNHPGGWVRVRVDADGPTASRPSRSPTRPRRGHECGRRSRHRPHRGRARPWPRTAARSCATTSIRSRVVVRVQLPTGDASPADRAVGAVVGIRHRSGLTDR